MKRLLIAYVGSALALAPVSAEVRSAIWLAGASSPDTYLAASPDRMVDGSGLSNPTQAAAGASLADLSGVIHTFGVRDLDSWVTNQSLEADYFAAKPAPVLVFDLGADAWLRNLVFWQYEYFSGGTGLSGNAARVIEIRFATSAEGANFSPEAAATATLQSVDFGSGGINFPQFFSLGSGVRARYVQLTVTDNFFGVPGIRGGGDRVGIGEVRFNASDGAQTVIAAAPNEFELRSANLAAPDLTAVESGLNAWGLANDPQRERILWTEPTSGRVGWTGYGSRSGQGGTLLDAPGLVLHGIDLDCENDVLYLLDSSSDAMLAFDMGSRQLSTLSSVELFIRPNAIDFDPQDGTIAVTDSGRDTVYLLDQSGAVLHLLQNANTVGAWGVACDPTSAVVFFTSHDLGHLVSWLPADGTVSTIATGLDRPRGLEIDRFGRIFCLESGAGRVVEIDRVTGDITTTDVGSAPGGRDLVLYDAADTDGDLLLDWWEVRDGRPLCALGALGDPEQDSATALSEMLFGGTTSDRTGASFGRLSAGPGSSTLRMEFETLLHENYEYELLLSSDLQNWHTSSVTPSFAPLGDGYSVTRRFVVDPVAEGLDPKSVFGRLRGRIIQTP
ncbi:MAG: hypothetical protein ACR2RV_08405 [Verrucomicrobiales bacterium]